MLMLKMWNSEIGTRFNADGSAIEWGSFNLTVITEWYQTNGSARRKILDSSPKIQEFMNVTKDISNAVHELYFSKWWFYLEEIDNLRRYKFTGKEL